MGHVEGRGHVECGSHVKGRSHIEGRSHLEGRSHVEGRGHVEGTPCIENDGQTNPELTLSVNRKLDFGGRKTHAPPGDGTAAPQLRRSFEVPPYRPGS